MIHSLGLPTFPYIYPLFRNSTLPERIFPLLTMATEVCTAIRTELLQHLVENIIATPEMVCAHTYTESLEWS